MLRGLSVGLLSLGIITGEAAAQGLPAPGAGELPKLRGGYLHFGFSLAKQADQGTLFVGGAVVPGAAYSTPMTAVPAFEAGWYLRDGLALSVSGTVPAAFSNSAAGTLTGLGNLGDETDGYYALTGHVHLPVTDRLAPYFGGGLGYMRVFSTSDGVVSNFAVNSAFGPVLQAGIDYRFNEHFGLFADAKRYFISTEANGNLGPAQVTAQARVDPWVVTTGASVFW